MKHLTLIGLSCFMIASLCARPALAAEAKLVMSDGVSSSTYEDDIPVYGPANAADGDLGTYWAGDPGQSRWWIFFDTKESGPISSVHLNWRGPDYAPSYYRTLISPDARTWEMVEDSLAGDWSKTEIRPINRQGRYIGIYIVSINKEGSYPALAEFHAYKKSPLPGSITFQAMLSDRDEGPRSGLFDITFRLYETETGGEPIWQEAHSGVTVAKGVVDVELGSVKELDCAFDKQYWLSVEVNKDGEMAPRFKLTSVPYAIRSIE